MAIEVYSEQNIQIKKPTISYGLQIADLVKNCPPLDLNSTYHYFIQSHYFSETCAIAVNEDDKVLGYVSGFINPKDHKTLFIWQVAISECSRGKSLATKLIHFILRHHDIEFIETTITQDNKASQSLFKKISKDLETEITEVSFLDKSKHFSNQHDSEYLFRIGPLKIPKEKNENI